MPNGYWIVRVSVRNAVRYPEYLTRCRAAEKAHELTSLQ